MGKTILDCEIYTFAPMQDGQPHIAMIEGFDWVFHGESPVAAHMKADVWRRKRWNEIQGRNNQVPEKGPLFRPRSKAAKAEKAAKAAKAAKADEGAQA